MSNDSIKLIRSNELTLASLASQTAKTAFDCIFENILTIVAFVPMHHRDTPEMEDTGTSNYLVYTSADFVQRLFNDFLSIGCQNGKIFHLLCALAQDSEIRKNLLGMLGLTFV